MTTTNFLTVAVLGSPARGNQLYTYRLSDRLVDQIVPGQIVLVEFGRRELLGVAIARTASSPVRNTKPVLAILHPTPQVGPVQRALAAWTADRFAVPVGAVLVAMLPPAIEKRVIHQLTPARAIDPEQLTPHQVGILKALGELKIATGAELVDQLGRRVAQTTITAMVRDGWIRRWSQLELPAAGTAIAQLEIPPAVALGRLEELSGKPAQRRLLHKLIAAGEPVATRALLKAANSTSGPLKRLTDSGLVSLRRRYELPPLGRADESDMEDLAAQNALTAFLDRPGFGTLLMQGRFAERVPAYVRAINATLAQNRQILVLAPTLAEAARLAKLLKGRLAGRTSLLAEATTPARRTSLWRALRAGEIDVLIGSPRAVWAPMAQLGLGDRRSRRGPALQRPAAADGGQRSGRPAVGRTFRLPGHIGAPPPRWRQRLTRLRARQSDSFYCAQPAYCGSSA